MDLLALFIMHVFYIGNFKGDSVHQQNFLFIVISSWIEVEMGSRHVPLDVEHDFFVAACFIFPSTFLSQILIKGRWSVPKKLDFWTDCVSVIFNFLLSHSSSSIQDALLVFFYIDILSILLSPCHHFEKGRCIRAECVNLGGVHLARRVVECVACEAFLLINIT